MIGRCSPVTCSLFANDGGALETVHLRHLDVHEHTAEPDKRRVLQNRERLPPVVRHHDRVPALLEQTPGHQLVDAVVLDEKNAPGVARFAQGVARDQRRPIPFSRLRHPVPDRMASRRSERLMGLGR